MLAREKYDQIFEVARRIQYPGVDQFEFTRKFAVNRDQLDCAARTLACPLKANPPHWQHGRIIYAAAMNRLMRDNEGTFLDIGTAKGFSACVMSWAIADSHSEQSVISIDVVDPMLKVTRNSVAELEGLKTVPEFVAYHKATGVKITFLSCGSLMWLRHAVQYGGHRVAFAFVDGKHSYDVVSEEIAMLKLLQQLGDVAVFDDLQISPVNKAVSEIAGYDVLRVDADPRQYGVAIRR